MRRKRRRIGLLDSALVVGLIVLAAAGCATVKWGYNPPDAKKVLVATGYCKCGICCGWHRNWLLRPVISSGPNKGRTKRVGVTASGTRARPGTIAADRTRYPFGTILHVEGYGYGRVEDTGSAITGDLIDLYFKTHQEAAEWGRQPVRVRVWYPEGAKKPAPARVALSRRGAG